MLKLVYKYILAVVPILRSLYLIIGRIYLSTRRHELRREILWNRGTKYEGEVAGKVRSSNFYYVGS